MDLFFATQPRPGMSGRLVVLTWLILTMGSASWAGEAGSSLADLRTRAEAGEGAAQLALAMRLDGHDSPIERNMEEALRWYKAAAAKGYAEAQTTLALMYIKGEGTSPDPREAARWFAKAAALGHPVAQLNLASCYANGEGVPRNMQEAARWYREAAEKNQAMGQYYLGILYGRGEGVPQSYVEAYKWLSAAAAQGVEAARSSLETLDSVLTAEELAEARKAAASMLKGLVGR